MCVGDKVEVVGGTLGGKFGEIFSIMDGGKYLVIIAGSEHILNGIQLIKVTTT